MTDDVRSRETSGLTSQLVDLIRTNLRTRPGQTPIYVDLDGHAAAVGREQHQVIFGRRGSGKSTLLLTLAEECNRSDTRHALYFTADLVKRAPYADAVARVVLEVLQSLPGSGSGSRRQLLRVLIGELQSLISQESQQEVTTQTASRTDASASGKFGSGHVGVSASGGSQRSVMVTATYTSRKEELLTRRLPDYSAELARALKNSNIDQSYLLLDDFYLLERALQPDVVDYLHGMLNGTGMFLKVASIQHRTTLSRVDGAFIGVEVGQDIERIDLDLTLEQPDRTAIHLSSILDTLAGQVGMPDFTAQRFDGSSLSLLVLASGGVVRDFLELFCRTASNLSFEEGRAVDTDQVVAAIADYWSTSKMPALRTDLSMSDARLLEEVFTDFRRFCLQESVSPIFGVMRSDLVGFPEVAAAVEELVDLKFLHVLSRTAEVDERGESVNAYLLDLSAYNLLQEALHEEGLSRLLGGQALDQVPLSALYVLSRANILLGAVLSDFEESGAGAADGGASASGLTAAEPAAVESISRPLPEPSASDAPLPRRLPKARLARTTSFTVGGAEGYVTAETFDSGELGEIRIRLGKSGSTLSGIMDAFSVMTSMALQYGVPLDEMVNKMTNLRFEPAGLSDDPDIRMAQSIMDYVFRRLALDHLAFESRATLGIFSAEERQRHLETGSYTLPDE